MLRPQPTTPRASPAGCPRPLILVADDDADLRTYVCLSLANGGQADTVEACSGTEALTLARALHPALIVSDVMMPGMSGAALCRALKADAATAAIPVLLISGETRAPPDEADGYLAKPFHAAALRAEVDRLLAHAA